MSFRFTTPGFYMVAGVTSDKRIAEICNLHLVKNYFFKSVAIDISMSAMVVILASTT